MLSWARNAAGISREMAATRAGTKPDRIRAWEDEKTGVKPTVRQARKLAALYGRSFLEFFRDYPPALSEPTVIADFRLHRGVPEPEEQREMKEIRLWAESQRSNALDLCELIGEALPRIPDDLFSTTRDDAECVARNARGIMGFQINDQIGLNANKRDQVAVVLRHKIEMMGILAVRLSRLGGLGVRGFCIALFPLPILAFGQEAPVAQVFTLTHEFAHILLKASAISGPLSTSGNTDNEKETEDWCKKFAGAFLVPSAFLADRVPKPPKPRAEISDQMLADLAGYFAVSRHAMLIRLVSLGYVRASFYWDRKKAEFETEESAYKRFARPSYYGSRYKGKLGDLYTSLVLEAWSSGRLTNHHAAEYMGISNLEHLNDIKEHFGG